MLRTNQSHREDIMAENSDKVDLSPRESVLAEAASLITGDRNKTYGSPTQNFQNTAELWTVLLRHKLKDGEVIDPNEVGTLMVALKLARTVAQDKRDNYVDMAGYAACAHEASVGSEEEAPTEQPLWSGSFRGPEPPTHVKVLRRTNGEDHGERLYRRTSGLWSWATRSDYTDSEWETDFLQGLDGFKWMSGGFRPDYEFEEVRD